MGQNAIRHLDELRGGNSIIGGTNQPQLRLVPGGTAGLGGPEQRSSFTAAKRGTKPRGIVTEKVTWRDDRPIMAGCDL